MYQLPVNGSICGTAGCCFAGLLVLTTTAPEDSVLVTNTFVVVSLLTGEGDSSCVIPRSFLIAFTQRFK